MCTQKKNRIFVSSAVKPSDIETISYNTTKYMETAMNVHSVIIKLMNATFLRFTSENIQERDHLNVNFVITAS